MNTEFIWWQDWAGRMVTDHLVRHRCLCGQSRRHIPDTRLRATWEERSKCFWIWIKEFSKCHRGKSKLSKHNRIRKLTLGLRLYGLGAVSTQRLRRLWTWIRTYDTLVNLDTYIWYTLVPLEYCPMAFLLTSIHYKISWNIYFHPPLINIGQTCQG